MGFIKFFKELYAFGKLMKELPGQIEQQNQVYRAISASDLAALPDEDLFAAAQSRTEACLDAREFDALSHPQQVFIVVNTLEMEVNNGGLCQFFVNSSRNYAPYVSGSLAEIGAEAHKTLFDRFIHRRGIDLNDLSSFQIQRIKDFEKQVKRYPFDEYDDRFYELPSLEEPLTRYIRDNLNAF